MSPRKKSSESPVTPDNIGARANEILEGYIRDPESYFSELEGVIGNPITLGPRVVTPEAWADDQIKAATAKGAKWLEKSLTPRKDPKAAALAAAPKYQMKMEEALRDKAWEGGIGRYDLDIRQQIIKNVGAAGFTAGLATHKPKIDAAVKDLQPRVLALAKAIDEMPVVTDADLDARMLAARHGMIDLGRARKGLAPKYGGR